VLGLRQRLPPLQEILDRHADFAAAAAAEVREIYGIELILRQRLFPRRDKSKYPGQQYHDYKRYRPLVEVCQANTPDNAILCNEANGFYIVKPDVSAIFVSRGQEGGSQLFISISIMILIRAIGFDIELAVIRDVPRTETPYAAPLTDWLKAVIMEACYSRRDVRVCALLSFYI